MKKLLIITMVGMMLTGVGCKQTDKVAEGIDKNTKQIEEYQEEKPVEEKKNSDEERYTNAEEFIENTIKEKNNDDSCKFTIAREKNVICIRMEMDMEGYKMSDIYDLYGYTKQEAYEVLGFNVILESIDTFASTGQLETRRQFGTDIDIIVDVYFGDDRVYCVDGYGNVEYNYFDEQ